MATGEETHIEKDRAKDIKTETASEIGRQAHRQKEMRRGWKETKRDEAWRERDIKRGEER